MRDKAFKGMIFLFELGGWRDAFAPKGENELIANLLPRNLLNKCKIFLILDILIDAV